MAERQIMKINFKNFVWLMLLTALGFAANLTAAEDTNTIIISSASDWQTSMNDSTNWSRNIILTADIDLLGITLSPIGTHEIPFTGSFNGNGHVIYNLTINAPDSNCVGLFGCIYKGQVTKLGLSSVSITGHDYVGGIAGLNFGGIITSCYVTGSVDGLLYVGGLVGYSTAAEEYD